MRHSILSVEFWISPKSQVRERLKKNTLLAVILAIPASPFGRSGVHYDRWERC